MIDERAAGAATAQLFLPNRRSGMATLPGMTTVSDGPGDLHLATVVVNVQDMRRAVAFWCAALGYRQREAEMDSRFVMLVHPEGRRLPVSLQLADAPPSEPVRVHLDLYTSEQARHVERLVGLGATRVVDWPYPDDPDFVVLRDPDGNEFCVIDHAGL
jgi:catechol 2,3-dioxygenase-like lactoylglutathione lyase family enzyme